MEEINNANFLRRTTVTTKLLPVCTGDVIALPWRSGHERPVANPCYPRVALVVVVCVPACACSSFCFLKKEKKTLPLYGYGAVNLQRCVRLFARVTRKKNCFVLAKNCGCYKILKLTVCVCHGQRI